MIKGELHSDIQERFKYHFDYFSFSIKGIRNLNTEEAKIHQSKNKNQNKNKIKYFEIQKFKIEIQNL